MLEEYFGRPVQKLVKMDQAIAFGATIHAAMLSGYDYFKTKCAPIVEEIKESEHIENIPDIDKEDELNITQDDTDVRAEE